MTAWNETRGTCLVQGGRSAFTFWERTKGLLGTSSLEPGDGLYIDNCQSIHSFFMQYRFDAVFLNRQRTVVHLIRAMKPWRVSKLVLSAHCVLELPAGVIAATGTEKGDQIRWELA